MHEAEQITKIRQENLHLKEKLNSLLKDSSIMLWFFVIMIDIISYINFTKLYIQSQVYIV